MVSSLTYTARENDNSVLRVCHKCIDYGSTHWPRSAGNSDDAHCEEDWKFYNYIRTIQCWREVVPQNTWGVMSENL